jgi:hypothetical protein
MISGRAMERLHMSASTQQPQDFWPFFPVFFICLWVCVGFIISRMGWHAFATRYPMQARPSGTAYNSPSSWFGIIFACYRNVVRVVFTDAGVYFYAMFLFRAFHPPFLVPWQSVKRVEKKDGFFGPRFRLDIEDAAGEIHVVLPRKVENELLRYYRAV